jgi:hypothetical protein
LTSPEMRAAAARDRRRAAALLRWYPRSWRDRYGDEFTELLLADLAERPACWRRTADVVRSGMLARLTCTGLSGHELAPADCVRACMATIGCAAAAALLFGSAMLAQLATGWQWASPRASSAEVGTLVLAAAVCCLLVIAVAAALPVAWAAGRELVADPHGALIWPAWLTLTCAAGLITGARHFQNGWPGTGGTGAHHGLVPGGIAAFGWASTLSVSSYWAHPAALSRFPSAELAWMLTSPLAGLGIVVGVVQMLRRMTMSARLLRHLSRLASAFAIAVAGLLVGAATWVLGSGAGRGGLFHPGTVGAAGLAVIALALVVVLRATTKVSAAARAGLRAAPR